MPHLFLLFLLIVSSFAQATTTRQDPFNKQHPISSQTTTATQEISCAKSPALAENSHFAQLTLIGIVLNNHSQTLFFLDEKQQLFSAAPQEFIAKEGFQIHKIEQNRIHFFDWRQSKNCTTPTTFTMKF
ncbi:hypothetical protein [Conservatibacter flavescens]|uniref:Competence protein ComD n=1 Tax=Conservatibacter flavescens TaxID=28161 RepID=A0A2M8S0Q5_9PAST|nr:hypothetical protein [Conservatibacter flavescens]PJG84733.1 hypothetical protein CVP05_09330 [Conservatibacter flavescens]